MTTWTIRFIWLLVILEIIYLLVANVGLNQPFVKAEINRIKPDKFSVQWQQLRSYFPTHVSVLAFSASGATKRNSWQVSGDKASLQLDLGAFFNRTLRVKNGSLKNVDFVLTRTLAENVSSNGHTENGSDRLKDGSQKARKKWVVGISNVDIEGMHRVTVPQGTATFDGELSGTLSYSVATRELAVTNGEVDLRIKTLVRGDQPWLSDGSSMRGQFQLLPFVPAEQRGKKALSFLQAEAEVTFESGDISFLNPYLQRFKGMTLAGKGKIDGTVKFDRGELIPPTELKVSAAPLDLDLLRLRLSGDGDITLKVDKRESSDLVAVVQFKELTGYDRDSGDLLVQGSDLTVEARAPGFSLLEKPTGVPDGEVSLTIPRMEVPDIRVYQTYVPEKLRFALNGGSGFLEGTVEVGQDSGTVNLALSAQDASVALDRYDFTSGLEILLALEVGSFILPSLDLSGTAVSLKNAKVHTTSEENPATNLNPFSMTLEIVEGAAQLGDPADGKSPQHWIEMVRQKQTRDLFEQAAIDVSVKGQVSDLRWIEQLIKNKNGFTIEGEGKLNAQLSARDGYIKTGSRLSIAPENLAASFLDYRISGDGGIVVEVSRGGQAPDVVSTVRFDSGTLSRISDTAEFASVSNVLLTAVSREVDLDAPIDNTDLHIQIPSATVLDMTVYNSFLPPQSPLKLLSGTADLNADIKLSKEDAKGRIELETDGFKAALDTQSIGARLSMGVDIIGGDPSQMRFDISGSTLTIDQIEVKNDDSVSESWKDGAWLGELMMKKSLVRWRKPIELHLEADLQLTDTRPFVSILSNHTGRRDWLEKLLSVENVKGTGTMSLDKNIMRFPLVFVDAGDVKLGAKGLINGTDREGVVYARYKKLGGLLRIAGEKTGFDLLKTRAKFDGYSPGQPVFPAKKSARSTSRTNKDTLSAPEAGARP